MIPLYDVTIETGGLEVVLNTNNDETQNYIKDQYPPRMGDWLVLYPGDKHQSLPKLIKAKAGDLILWDSRTIHGGRIGKGYTAENNPLNQGDFARLSFTVTMTPKSFLPKSDKSKNTVLYGRRNAYLKGYGTNHWPHEYNQVPTGCNGQTVKYKMADYKPVEETPLITSLLGMSQEEMNEWNE